MKVRLIAIGKTDDPLIVGLVQQYVERLRHYIPFEVIEIPDIKNSKSLSRKEQQIKEGERILKCVKPAEKLVLLDENGRTFSSRGFADYLNQESCSGTRVLNFVIGGPYGFSEEIYNFCQGKISLSRMTFSHQMIRPFIVEQIYRAMTILKGEPYHHD